MGRYVRTVLRGLANAPDVDLTLLVRDPRNAATYRAIVGDIAVAPLRTAHLRSRFDCIWFPWNGIRFNARAPAVVTINDDFAFSYAAQGRIARWREQRPIERAVKRACLLTTISQWARAQLIDRFSLATERITVIPLAPDATFAPGAERSPYSEPFVLVVGTREARKNIDFFIDAFKLAFPANDVRLAVVGTLDERTRNTTRTSSMLVSERANVDDEALRRLYRTAAAVAVPSLAEGFGLVAAEAQACGAAVIAADASALPETVGDAGILIDPRDLNAWALALRKLVREPELNAYYRARSAVRWPPNSGDRTMTAIMAVFERAIHDRP